MRSAAAWAYRHRWPLSLGLSWLVVWLLGYVGFQSLPLRDGEVPRTPWDNAYLSLQLFVVAGGADRGVVGTSLQAARFLAPAVAAYAAVQALITVFSAQAQAAWVRLTYHDHVVICGLGQIGSTLCGKFLEQKKKVIVIEQDRDNDLIKECQERGAIVLVGDATSASTLRAARVDAAESLVAVCGSDGTNAEIAAQGRLFARGGRKLSCLAHVTDPHLCHFLAGLAMTHWMQESYQMEFFNIFDRGARSLLAHDPFGLRSGTDARNPHILVIGMGALGQSLAVRAERIWRSSFEGTGVPLRISVIDSDAERWVDLLCLEHPFLTTSCRIVPHTLDVRSPGFLRKWPPLDAPDLDGVTKVYVCLDDESAGLTVALTLLQRTRSSRLPIVLCLPRDAGLTGLLSARRDNTRHGTRERLATAGSDGTDHGTPINEVATPTPGLEAFALLDRTFTPSLLLEGISEDLAMAVHERYRVGQLQRLGRKPGEPGLDPSLAPWLPIRRGDTTLAEHLREKNRSHAYSIGPRLWREGYGIEPLGTVRAAEFRFDELTKMESEKGGPAETELDHLARLEHERWLLDMRRDGWTYGPKRDPVKRVSPFILPWTPGPESPEPGLALSEAGRETSRQMIRDWPVILARFDLQIYRRRSVPDPKSEPRKVGSV